MPSEDNSRIEDLKKSLYSRGAPDIRTRRKLRFGDITTEIKTDWEKPAEEPVKPILNQVYEDHSMPFIKKLLLFSILFCIIAVGAGAFIFFNGANLISANNIDITVAGPVSVSGGTPVTFDITIANNNNIDLQMVDFSVNFPAGTTDPDDSTKELTSYREFIGDIPAGQNIKKTVRAIIFGEENIQKQVIANITYQVKGSTSSFTKERAYDILINSSPVIMNVTGVEEAISGQEFDLKVEVKSNSQEVLKNIILSGTYPFGYSYISSDLKNTVNNATWRIGDIPAGGKKNITIRGKLQGENAETKVFTFKVGAQSSKNQNAIGTEYMALSKEIVIQKPFMTVGISIENDHGTEDATAEFNQPVQVEVSWFNNLPSAISDAEIVVRLSGTAYDKNLVQINSGYFRSGTNDIVFNQQTIPQLALVGAGEGGSVSFSITPRDFSMAGKRIVNPIVTLTAGVSGRRTQETGVAGELTSAATRNIRVGTDVALSGKVLRTSGPLTNSGPIPPKAEQVTTYTIHWVIDNTANVVRDIKVVSKIPPYVKWTDQISPTTEDIYINKDSGIITWNAGTIGTYTATSGGQKKEVYFQVSIEPSINQIGSVPILVFDASLTGTDSYTGNPVSATQSALTTSFSTDSSFRERDETVVK